MTVQTPVSSGSEVSALQPMAAGFEPSQLEGEESEDSLSGSTGSRDAWGRTTANILEENVWWYMTKRQWRDGPRVTFDRYKKEFRIEYSFADSGNVLNVSLTTKFQAGTVAFDEGVAAAEFQQAQLLKAEAEQASSQQEPGSDGGLLAWSLEEPVTDGGSLASSQAPTVDETGRERLDYPGWFMPRTPWNPPGLEDDFWRLDLTSENVWGFWPPLNFWMHGPVVTAVDLDKKAVWIVHALENKKETATIHQKMSFESGTVYFQTRPDQTPQVPWYPSWYSRRPPVVPV